MPSTARNRSVQAVEAIPVKRGAGVNAPSDAEGTDLIPEIDAGRVVDSTGILNPDLRERLDKLEREYATILTRLDRMTARHRRLIKDEKSSH